MARGGRPRPRPTRTKSGGSKRRKIPTRQRAPPTQPRPKPFSSDISDQQRIGNVGFRPRPATIPARIKAGARSRIRGRTPLVAKGRGFGGEPAVLTQETRPFGSLGTRNVAKKALGGVRQKKFTSRARQSAKSFAEFKRKNTVTKGELFSPNLAQILSTGRSEKQQRLDVIKQKQIIKVGRAVKRFVSKRRKPSKPTGLRSRPRPTRVTVASPSGRGRTITVSSRSVQRKIRKRTKTKARGRQVPIRRSPVRRRTFGSDFDIFRVGATAVRPSVSPPPRPPARLPRRARIAPRPTGRRRVPLRRRREVRAGSDFDVLNFFA